jgi:hypothetical protein
MRSILSRLHKEPLLHFLFAGILLFVLFDWLPQEPSDNGRSIQVGNEQLLQVIMFQSPRLTRDAASEYLSSLDADQRSLLVENYVREEVLYRQAVALGLNKNNYNARRRLISQLEYINQGFITESLVITEDELQAYYEDNKDRYFVTAQITFTHVYFSGEGPDDRSARLMAEQELRHLNESRLPFHLAGSRGDHFLYHRNYVNKDQEEVASHFGDGFGEEVFKLDDNGGRWSGPFQSSYGYHLVLVSSVKPGYFPPLDEVRARIADDVTRVRVRQELDQFYREIRDTYYISVIDSDSLS